MTVDSLVVIFAFFDPLGDGRALVVVWEGIFQGFRIELEFAARGGQFILFWVVIKVAVSGHVIFPIFRGVGRLKYHRL